ncbi:Uncharacterized membrane protein [Clostridium cavendishii DSM 21758]|uniref:Uncharacterized membrane protein n=1 Tax=Clostridium cavendishii DSM 21758 TaxID=1121302 RepID=A0A1M6EC04_9CLOT|nr:DUF5808 domain-containing protein [Clostridium cavendishii]SHI83016.1 Uncharacterized membrane protein [Clostridium cavendishii DSM 21758]
MKTGLILNTFLILLLTILAFFMQKLSQRSVFYGIRIPIGFEDNKQLISEDKRYKVKLLMSESLVYIISSIMILKFNEDYAPAIVMLSMIMAMLIISICYYNANKKVKAIKLKENWISLMTKEKVVMVDLNMKNRKAERLSSWYFMPNIIIFIAIGIVNVINYKKVDIIAILIFLVMLIIMYISFISVNKARQNLNGGEVNSIRAQNIKFRKINAVFIIVNSYLLSLLFAVSNLSELNIISANIESNLISISICLILLISILISIYSFKMGQGGKNLKVGNEEKSEVINRDDDNDYKFGMFYYNKNDNAVWVEKRSGSGYTVNFATPIGKIFGVLITAILVGSVGIVIYMSISMKVDLNIDNASVNIKGMYSENINRKEIKEVKLEDGLPKITMKQNGAAIGKKKIGYFRMQDGDKAKLFVENAKEKVVKILTSDKIIYINYDDENKTKELYEKLRLD